MDAETKRKIQLLEWDLRNIKEGRIREIRLKELDALKQQL